MAITSTRHARCLCTELVNRTVVVLFTLITGKGTAALIFKGLGEAGRGDGQSLGGANTATCAVGIGLAGFDFGEGSGATSSGASAGEVGDSGIGNGAGFVTDAT